MKVLRLSFLALILPTLAFAKTPLPVKPAGFNAEFVANLDEVQEKIITLAEATPQEAFAWRPASGVRSISEVYMHIAGGNYFLATFVGVKPPKMADDLEKTVTKKADVIAELKRSFEHLRKAALSAKDLEHPVKMFGNQTTYRGVLMTMLSHLHEHLGQSIAYARMNGVVPPWSR
ncbi:MAG TPA: DinB family protein [Thermoanaerobaculia bacterium]|nr:DinB family protein [Thermoanaerobaculia bacterium]